MRIQIDEIQTCIFRLDESVRTHDHNQVTHHAGMVFSAVIQAWKSAVDLPASQYQQLHDLFGALAYMSLNFAIFNHLWTPAKMKSFLTELEGVFDQLKYRVEEMDSDEGSGPGPSYYARIYAEVLGYGVEFLETAVQKNCQGCVVRALKQMWKILEGAREAIAHLPSEQQFEVARRSYSDIRYELEEIEEALKHRGLSEVNRILPRLRRAIQRFQEDVQQ